MTANSFDWDDELPPETEEEVYGALLRALRRKQGFGLFFVQCSKAQGEKAVADLRRDLPQQRIQELHLQGEVVTLYDQIADRWQQQPFEVLAIEGLQASLYAYEDTRRFSGWSSDEIYNYSWKGVPKILNHLNQQREHLRNDFPVRFVFLVPPFVVDYFIQRAADFLDWRSGLFRFPRDPKEIAQDAERFFVEGGYKKYLTLTPQARIEKILEIKSLQEICPDSENKSKLLFQLGLLYAAEKDYENAIASCVKALGFKPDDDTTSFIRGMALHVLGRYEEALANYDKALELRPDLHQVWSNLGDVLSISERYKEAIASYDKALQLKPDNQDAWYDRGVALSYLGRYKEAIASYDKALQLKPDNQDAWYDRGVALSYLGREEEAIASYDKALEFKLDDQDAWSNRGIALSALGRYEEALISYGKALQIQPDFADAYYNKACCYGLQKNVDLAIETLQHAINLDSKYWGMAKTDSEFDGIRDDERFQALLEE